MIIKILSWLVFLLASSEPVLVFLALKHSATISWFEIVMAISYTLIGLMGMATAIWVFRFEIKMGKLVTEGWE